MRTFEVAIPVTGWQVFTVDAEDASQAIDMVMNGEVETDEFNDMEWVLDTNQWDVEEVD